MLHDEIMSIHTALGGVLRHVDPERAEIVRQCRRNLEAAADQAHALENSTVLELDPDACRAAVKEALQ